MHIHHIFFIYTFTDGNLDWFRALAIVTNSGVSTGAQVPFDTLIPFPLCIYPNVEYLDHMIVLHLVFWRPSILAVLLYVPTNNAQELMRPFLKMLCLNLSHLPWRRTKVPTAERLYSLMQQPSKSWNKMLISWPKNWSNCDMEKIPMSSPSAVWSLASQGTDLGYGIFSLVKKNGNSNF